FNQARGRLSNSTDQVIQMRNTPMHTRTMLPVLLAIASSLATLSTAAGQEYPSRPITLVVPFAAGGPTDTVARIIAEPMRAALGQSIIVENVVGASGTVGTGRVARASPDGHTIVVGYWGTHVLNGALFSLQYDVLRDFAPVALLAT